MDLRFTESFAIIVYMEQYLQLTPHQFDQDEKLWWRVIADQWLKKYVLSDMKDCSKIIEAIDLMRLYIDTYQFDIEDLWLKELIRFHVWQLYADISHYDDALEYFIWLQNEWYDKVGVEYLDFTINFLQWNIDACETIIVWLQKDWSTINAETMQRMIEYKNNSYLEAYSGMRRDELKQWIIENKK